MLDIVIAFDTTGSMASYIKSVKEYVTELVPKLFAINPHLRLGVVAFGDYCDIERLQDSVCLKRWQIQMYGYGH